MIRRETDYALRMMIFLARSQIANPDLACASTASLARETDVPYRFLRKIVLKLSTSGLLVSRRGKKGGVMLGKAPEKISLLEVLRAVEPESVLLNSCFLQNASNCARVSYCGLHQAFSHAQVALQHELGGITIASMATAEVDALA